MHRPSGNLDVPGFSGPQGKMVHLCSLLLRLDHHHHHHHHHLTRHVRCRRNFLLQNQNHQDRKNILFFIWDSRTGIG